MGTAMQKSTNKQKKEKNVRIAYIQEQCEISSIRNSLKNNMTCSFSQ